MDNTPEGRRRYADMVEAKRKADKAIAQANGTDVSLGAQVKDGLETGLGAYLAWEAIGGALRGLFKD